MMAGDILITEWQYKRQVFKQDWLPVRVSRETTLYRYAHALKPYGGKLYDPMAEARAAFRMAVACDGVDAWDDQFKALTDQFVYSLEQAPKSLVFLVEGDEDFDFTYGAFCTACAETKFPISDWLFEREFGNTYSIRHIEIARLDLTDDAD